MSWVLIINFIVCFFAIARADVRPFAEYEPVKYVFMSTGFDYQSQDAKIKILSQLPPEITPVIYSTFEPELQRFKAAIQELHLQNVIYLELHSPGEIFWARDSLPYPVVSANGFELVDLQYAKDFEPDKEIANHFQQPLRKLKHHFEHGNLLANRKGDCLVVKDNFSGFITDDNFKESYGCQKIIRLPYVQGIGHIDEVVKFISDTIVLTNEPQFIPILQQLGYDVRNLPQAAQLPAKVVKQGAMPSRSYINSLLVNSTVFVPTFGTPEDDIALSVYRSLGLIVIGVESSYLSDWGGGGLHCMTMTYPDFNLFLNRN